MKKVQKIRESDVAVGGATTAPRSVVTANPPDADALAIANPPDADADALAIADASCNASRGCRADVPPIFKDTTGNKETTRGGGPSPAGTASYTG